MADIDELRGTPKGSTAKKGSIVPPAVREAAVTAAMTASVLSGGPAAAQEQKPNFKAGAHIENVETAPAATREEGALDYAQEAEKVKAGATAEAHTTAEASAKANVEMSQAQEREKDALNEAEKAEDMNPEAADEAKAEAEARAAEARKAEAKAAEAKEAEAKAAETKEAETKATAEANAAEASAAEAMNEVYLDWNGKEFYLTDFNDPDGPEYEFSDDNLRNPGRTVRQEKREFEKRTSQETKFERNVIKDWEGVDKLLQTGAAGFFSYEDNSLIVNVVDKDFLQAENARVLSGKEEKAALKIALTPEDQRTDAMKETLDVAQKKGLLKYNLASLSAEDKDKIKGRLSELSDVDRRADTLSVINQAVELGQLGYADSYVEQDTKAHESTHINDFVNGRFLAGGLTTEHMQKLDMFTEINANMSQTKLALDHYKKTGEIPNFSLHCSNLEEIKTYIRDNAQNKDCEKHLAAMVYTGWLEKNNQPGAVYYKQAESNADTPALAGAYARPDLSDQEYHQRVDKMFKDSALGDVRDCVDADFALGKGSQKADNQMSASQSFMQRLTQGADNVKSATRKLARSLKKIFGKNTEGDLSFRVDENGQVIPGSVKSGDGQKVDPKVARKLYELSGRISPKKSASKTNAGRTQNIDLSAMAAMQNVHGGI